MPLGLPSSNARIMPGTIPTAIPGYIKGPYLASGSTDGSVYTPNKNPGSNPIFNYFDSSGNPMPLDQVTQIGTVADMYPKGYFDNYNPETFTPTYTDNSPYYRFGVGDVLKYTTQGTPYYAPNGQSGVQNNGQPAQPTIPQQNNQQNQTPISSLFPSPLPSQTTTPQTQFGSGFQNPYMPLPSYNLNQYPQAFANSGTQFQSDTSGGTGSYAPQNYNRLPNYGFYY